MSWGHYSWGHFAVFPCGLVAIHAFPLQDTSDIYGSPLGHENEYLFGELRALH